MQAIYLNAEWTIFNLQAREKYANLFIDVTKSKRKQHDRLFFLLAVSFSPVWVWLCRRKYVSENDTAPAMKSILATFIQVVNGRT